jgi:hypothetical protein
MAMSGPAENVASEQTGGLFVKEPWLEWHNRRPFAFACLDPGYAHRLAELAVKLEPQILNLSVAKGWENSAAQNPTGSRYAAYNAFLLDPSLLDLFLALRATYRFLISSIQVKPQPCYLQSWFNIHRAGQNLHRHEHMARFIGSFSAHAEGSVTRWGASPVTDESDYQLENRDGLLTVTVGRKHYHEVSLWQDQDRPRVSYAFDIVDQSAWRDDRVLIPFDGLGAGLP